MESRFELRAHHLNNVQTEQRSDSALRHSGITFLRQVNKYNVSKVDSSLLNITPYIPRDSSLERSPLHFIFNPN